MNADVQFGIGADDVARRALLLGTLVDLGTAADRNYIRTAVAIEASAQSALLPHIAAAVARNWANLGPAARAVMAVQPKRSSRGAIILLHCLRQWHGHYQELWHAGQRISDQIFSLLQHHELLQMLSTSGCVIKKPSMKRQTNGVGRTKEMRGMR